MSKPLFEITADMLAAYDAAVGADGEISETNAADVDALMRVEHAKLASYFWLIKKATMEADAAAKEASRFRAKAEVRETLVARLKQSLLDHMVATGQPIIDTEAGRFAMQKNPPPLVLDHGDGVQDVPEEYLRVTVEVNKAKVLADLKAGKELAFAKIGSPGFHLRLR